MRIQLLAAGAALCVLGMTGCTKEVGETGSLAGKPVVMTMQSTAVEPESRADYTGNNFSWRKGDKMSVLVNGVVGNENCKLTTNEEGKDAAFSGTVTGWDGSKEIYAFYPHSATPYGVSGESVSLTLPNPQSYTIGGAIDNSFMVGTGTATVTDGTIKASVNMKQAMSIIKLNITNAPGKVTGVKLKCTDAIFPTTATVTLSDASITSSGTTTNELSMNVTDNTDGATKVVSFAMFPTDLTGKTILVEVSFDGGKTKIIAKTGLNFARNTHYVMEFDGTLQDYIEVNGLKWAVGNLVSDGADGAKIGTPTDGGLYFQFGSLIGWSPAGEPLAIVAKPNNFNGSEEWPDQQYWQGTSVVPFTAAGSDNEKAGIGDPCRYYIEGTWRLPTITEFETLIANTNDYPTTGPWTWKKPFATHTSGLTLPAAGNRHNSSGASFHQGSYGYYWSSSVSASSVYGSFAFFSSATLSQNTVSRANGYSVRCVQE